MCGETHLRVPVANRYHMEERYTLVTKITFEVPEYHNQLKLGSKTSLRPLHALLLCRYVCSRLSLCPPHIHPIDFFGIKI